MDYKLSDLLDVPKLQKLLDDLDAIYSIPSAIIDMDGKILTGTAWQDICTKFHRVNPQTQQDCIKSDTHIVHELSKGKTQVVYKCPRKLIDTATPLIVDGEHIGNAFTGQFFFEHPDEEYYRKIAQDFGFDEELYIEAVRKVPIIKEEKHNKNLKVLAGLTEMLAEIGLQQKRQKVIENELEQIVYVASHDLRTPLVNIDGYNNEIVRLLNEINLILETNEISAEVKEKFDVIVKKNIPEAEHYISASISKMDALLSGLLKISRLGRRELKRERLDMNRLMSAISNTISYQLNEAGTSLEISELPSCSGDENQINNLFSNIIENALKYLNPERPGIIRISGRTEEGRSIYSVEDNGIGILPEHQDKIFEIFYQLKPKKSTGDGLGLSIVKKILEKHSGNIWLESEIGKGTKFYVSLPSR